MSKKDLCLLTILFLLLVGSSWAITPAQLFNLPFTSGNASVTYINGSVQLVTHNALSYAYASSGTFPASPNYTTSLSIDVSSDHPRMLFSHSSIGCSDGKSQCPVYWTNAYLTIQWLNSSFVEFGRIKYDIHSAQSHYDLYVVAPSGASYFQFSVLLNTPGDTLAVGGDSTVTVTSTSYSLNYSYNPGRIVLDNGSIRFGVQTLNGSMIDYMADSHTPTNNIVVPFAGNAIQTALYWLNEDGNPTQGGDSGSPTFPTGIAPTISWSYIYDLSGQIIGIDSLSQPVLYNRENHAGITTVSDLQVHQTVQFVPSSPNVLKTNYTWNHMASDSHILNPDGQQNTTSVVAVGFFRPSALGLDSGWTPQFACPNGTLTQVAFNPAAEFLSPQKWAGFTNSSNSFGPSLASGTTNTFFFQRDTANPPQWFFVQSINENLSLSGLGQFFSTSGYVILANINDIQTYICNNPL